MQPKMKRFIVAPLSRICRVALRICITGLISLVCLMVIARVLGLPVLTPSELLDKFKNVSRLAEILS